jgi:hypothetical protein
MGNAMNGDAAISNLIRDQPAGNWRNAAPTRQSVRFFRVRPHSRVQRPARPFLFPAG